MVADSSATTLNTGFRIYFAAGFVVLVEGAFDVMIFVYLDVVMGQNLDY